MRSGCATQTLDPRRLDLPHDRHHARLAWAYCVLGWGGWWFWDPVENASLMPWLFGTALVHCALIAERRQALVKWTALLGVLTFSMSLIGTFVVRSGVLTSVHAFAVDPGRGAFILALIVGFTGGGLALFGLRSNRLGEGAPFDLLSREGSLVFNNFMLITILATVFAGTFYPLAIDLFTHDKISVGSAVLRHHRRAAGRHPGAGDGGRTTAEMASGRLARRALAPQAARRLRAGRRWSSYSASTCQRACFPP